MNQKFNFIDNCAMKIALSKAKEAYKRNEVPVGAVLFIHNRLIATGYNLVNTTKDASMHAEMVCLKKAASILGDFRLNNAVMYVTLEPCAMCAGAIHQFRLKKIIWGAKDKRIGASGTLYNLFDGKNPIHSLESVGGLMEKDSEKLLKNFFREKRRKKVEGII